MPKDRGAALERSLLQQKREEALPRGKRNSVCKQTTQPDCRSQPTSILAAQKRLPVPTTRSMRCRNPGSRRSLAAGLQGLGVTNPDHRIPRTPRRRQRRRRLLSAPEEPTQLQAQLSRLTDWTHLKRLTDTLLSNGACQQVTRIEDLCTLRCPTGGFTTWTRAREVS